MAGEPLSPALAWRLRKPLVCASTELVLDRWLATLGEAPNLQQGGLAVVARRQRHGRGQWHRQWSSPPGGLWLSAAFAWPVPDAAPAAPLTLALAVGLALELEQLGVETQIKWPNDLLVGGRKLAGILARLRLQGGRVRWARAGIGINGTNRVPPGAISLGQALRPQQRRRFHPHATASALLPRALQAIAWAQQHSLSNAAVIALAEQRLLRPEGGWSHQGERWQVQGLSADGGLRLQRSGQTLTLRRQLELNPESHA